ncbi:GHMP family kinase ATP-binding protein [Fibrella aquatilis]|uniref:GHMP kinase n=1 Tax=Fibrella aquatilis TaxID=2817059 RepID=A0A939JU57_9BACT|nr:GHMP kinase [Fibrella aquatilis]MBO0929452.1 GHMP kinase [Fibrella aquatilis]
MIVSVISTAPARICLFGDDQDYLGLPVLTASLTLRTKLTAWHHGQPGFRFRFAHPGRRLSVAFDGIPLAYETDHDYLQACINVLLREGFTFSRGIEGDIQDEFPAGIGASSALVINWLNALAQLADQPARLTAAQLAQLTYAAEVLEFGHSSSHIDQQTTALGGLLYFPQGVAGTAQSLPVPLGSFMLVEWRDAVLETVGTADYPHQRSLSGDVLERIGRVNPGFSVQTAIPPEATEYKDQLSKDDYVLLKATLACRDLTTDALALLHAPHLNHARLGQLLTQLHTYLRDAYQLSSPQADRLLDVALRAGALGGKVIAGSRAGALLVYAPDNSRQVAEAIERAGGRATVVRLGAGVA